MTARIINRRAFLQVCGTITVGFIGTLALPTSQPAMADSPPRSNGFVASDPIARLAAEALAAVGDEQYASHRDKVASAVASRLELDLIAMQRAWAPADVDHQIAILTGLTQLGVPYRRNTSMPGVGFDCSGLTTYAWAGAGYDLTRQSTAQIRQSAPRSIETAQAGDLMQYPGHVMIWLGLGRAVLQSPNPRRTVEVVLYREGRNVKVGDPTGRVS